MNKGNIVGSWNLESFKLEDKDGIQSDWGKEMKGILIYSPCGKMSVGINKAVEPSDQGELQDTIDAMLFYSGTYEIKANEILHFVGIASDFDRVGKTMVRTANIESNRLTLFSPLNSSGRSILVWKKTEV